MKATYFKSSRHSLSSYEKDLVTAWGMSRRTVTLVSKLRDITGDEWQLSHKDTTKAATALREMGFEAFTKFTAEKAATIRRDVAEVMSDSSDDGERFALLEESVGTLRKNEHWHNGRVIKVHTV